MYPIFSYASISTSIFSFINLLCFPRIPALAFLSIPISSFSRDCLGTNKFYHIQRFAYLKATLYFLIGVLPSMAALATFVGYQLSGHVFTPTKAFVTLSLLNMIRYHKGLITWELIIIIINRFPLAYIPVMIITVSANVVAFSRCVVVIELLQRSVANVYLVCRSSWLSLRQCLQQVDLTWIRKF